jgi:hypothetical protein
MIKKILCLLFIFSIAVLNISAADKAPKVPKSKTQKADKYYNTGQYYTAATYYKKAFPKLKKSEVGQHLELENVLE